MPPTHESDLRPNSIFLLRQPGRIMVQFAYICNRMLRRKGAAANTYGTTKGLK